MKRFVLFISVFVFLYKPDLIYAALASLESGDAARQKSVLVSSESAVPDLDFVIRPEPDRNRDVLVSWEDTQFTNAFIVRPQAQRDSGVLVNRPAGLDLKILNIIYEAGISSVEDYSMWLKENIEYKKDDGSDSWAMPEDTLARQYGDCEDFAFLNAAVMRIFGYTPKVIGIVGSLIAENHAVCVFEKDGKYLWFDNATLKESPATSLVELSRFFKRNYLCAHVMEMDINDVSTSVAAETLKEK